MIASKHVLEWLYHISFIGSASFKRFHGKYDKVICHFVGATILLYGAHQFQMSDHYLCVFSFVWTRIDASGLQLTDVRSPVPASSRDPVTSVINYCALEHLRVAGVLGIATFF